MEQIIILMPWIWAAIGAITIVIELFSSDIDAIWFTAGSAVAFILSLFDLHIAIQLSAFVVITAVLLFTVGRLAKKAMLAKNISANSDSLIGKEVLVLEEANEFDNGSGVINDIVWTITCQAGVKVEKGTHAIILAIDENKLVVKSKDN